MQRLQGFSAVNAESEEHILELLGQYHGRARILAGGTDLLVAMKHGKVAPLELLINIKKLHSLNTLHGDPQQGLVIGALTPIADVEKSDFISAHYPALAQAAGQLGSVQVRNIATVGGNLCNASPSAELAPPLLVYAARAIVTAGNSHRVVPMEEFFLGPGRSTLGPGELLTRVMVPPPGHQRSVYLKFAPRRAMDIAVVGVAVALAQEPGSGVCRNVRIALGAVAPTPLRVKEAELLLEGRQADETLIAQAAAVAATSCRPITDIRATADYRRYIVELFTKRALLCLTQGEC